jgi:hypothetical protein
MPGLCPCRKSKERNRYAKVGAAVGSQIGASAGARVGPFATGLSAGLGGAVGYLTGSAVDAAKGDVSSVTPVPDGGRPAGADEHPAGGDEGGVVIPVDSDSEA